MFDHSIPFNRKQNLPSDIAVYAVYAGKTVLYVGSTWGLRRRFSAHNKLAMFSAFSADTIKWNTYTEETFKDIAEAEAELIAKLKPTLNGSNPKRISDSKKGLALQERGKQTLPSSNIHVYVYNLLWERIFSSAGKNYVLDKIASETGLTYSWLDSFARRVDTKSSPSIDRVEVLYTYLTGDTLLNLIQRKPSL